MDGTKNWFPELPAEIVDKIFVECLPSTKSRPSGFHPKHAPLLLTHVCSSWRTFALDCPNLWREFSLKYESRPNPKNFALQQERMLEQIALWRSATKGPRLTLSLHLHPPSWRMEEPLWQRHVQAAIVDHIENIHKLQLRLRGIEEAISFFQLPSERLSNLEDLHLDVIFFDDKIKAMEKISKAPGLRRLQLSAYTYVGGVPMTALPRCQQVTHLDLLEYHAPTPFHSILHSFPALEQLWATFYPSQLLPQWDGPVIVMKRLTNLSLTSQNHHDFEPSNFQHMSFPTLKYLRLSTSTVIQRPLFLWTTHDNIHQAHLLNQFHLLHTLVLTGQILSESVLLEALPSTPLLVKLVVDLDVKTYGSVFAGLINTHGMERTLLIPNLEEFAMCMNISEAGKEDGFEDEIDEFKGAILALLRSRCRSRHNETAIDDGRPVCLRKVLLCFEEDWPPTSDILLPQGWESQEVEFPFDDLDFESRAVSKQEWVDIQLSF